MMNTKKFMGKIISLNKRHIDQMAEIDFESEHQLDKASLEEFKERLIKRFKQGHELFFGYKGNGILKGYVAVKPFFPGYKHCEIYWLAVRKNYQGQGIGTKLMKFAEAYARGKGFRKVCLYTNKRMKKTRRFYEKLGYKPVNELPDFYGYPRNKTAVLYIKKV